MATIVSSLEHKINSELNNLRLKSKNQLQKDIFRLYSDSLFADILINVENETVKLHRCILQTRAPAFYSTYCQKPDLVRIVPCHKLKIFFRNIYCDTEIRPKEEELLKCIESAFPIDRPISSSSLEVSSDFELSNYFSINDSFVSVATSATKLHLLKDISKSSSCVNYSCFRNSDNTAYYSLVDESLVLSDFSDINEDVPWRRRRMSVHTNSLTNSTASEMDVVATSREPAASTITFVTSNASTTSNTVVAVEEAAVVEPAQGKCVPENSVISIQSGVVEKNLNLDELLRDTDVAIAESKKTVPTRKFFNFDGSGVDSDDVAQPNSNIVEQPSSGKTRKFFIDASDLIDEDEANNGSSGGGVNDTVLSAAEVADPELSSRRLTPLSSAPPLCVKSKVVAGRSAASLLPAYRLEKQTPDSLDDDPIQSNDCSNQPSPAQLRARLEADFQQASLAATVSAATQNEPKISNCCGNDDDGQTFLQTFCQRTDDRLFSSPPPSPSPSLSSLSRSIPFATFKTYLFEKYECARKNHAYSDDELQRLKVFDELVAQDETFAYLKCDLEEMLVAGAATKSRIATHKFLVKQYERHHEALATLVSVKTFIIDLLKQRRSSGDNAEKKFDQTPDSLNGDFVADAYDDEASAMAAEVDELFRKLLKTSTTPVEKQQKTESIGRAKNQRDAVTSSNRSCGFFIDLKEQTPKSKVAPAAACVDAAKEKSLPSKQLFSMFIDFGASTDSDSSMEVQNKFEKRKKQCISKLEKSRELRNSATSLNDGEVVAAGVGAASGARVATNVASSRRLEKIVQSTPLSCSTSATAVEKLLQSRTGAEDTSTVVLRRAKNCGGSPHPQVIRRSWNVDKTSELNHNYAATSGPKHKRSYSVSASQFDARVEPTSYIVDVNLNREEVGAAEFPSIGNADSTNELTVNGESEISSSHSYSERGDVKAELRQSSSCSTSVSTKVCSHGTSTTTASTNSVGGVDKDVVMPKSDENCNKTKEKVFVKLSDMDKEPKTLSSSSAAMAASSNDQWSSLRMTKSAIGTETSWFESKLLNGSVNSRSLSRIFPDLSASVLSKPNSDVDDTTISSMSSVQSSSAVSTCESNLELSNNASKCDNNTLGQDLLKMFLDEISTDVVVEVAGRRIKAHKCILTSRCQYFAALLSGGWVESAGNVLSIHGFSYNVVYFALCYIYSGESEIPENISIVELASLADYLCLEGLKEVVSCTLKMRYCHFFHKPCNICSVGVLECLPIAVNYGLDDIHRKSLRWISKHYVRLWCSKAFASLPRELIDKCYNQHVVNMTVNNVFETLTNCDKLFSFIPQTRWAEPCFAVTRKLHDYCIKFLANHFIDFLKSDAFLSIATNRTWGIIIMDEKTQLVCAKMRSDQLCQSYAYLSAQCKLAMASHENEELIELLNRVKHQIETTLVKIALQACQCSAWFQMDPELRSHIQTSAGLTFVPNEVKRRVETLKPRPSTITSGSRGVDLQQVKTVINRQHRQANNVRAHEPRSGKQATNQKLNSHHARSTSVRQNGTQNKENKGSTAKTSSHAHSKSPFRNKYANVKSRYMEHKSGKNDRATASETTPSETSEVERRPPAGHHKRPSKSLASSVHLSPGASIRQTARAVSLSKIPVSVRNSSQKRTDSDRDTTSGSDNGVCLERRDEGTTLSRANGAANGDAASDNAKRTPTSRRLMSSHSTSGARNANVTSTRASHAHSVMRKSYSSAGATDPAAENRSRLSTRAQSGAVTNSRRKSTVNDDVGNAANVGKRERGAVRRGSNNSTTLAPAVTVSVRARCSNHSSPDTRCRSNPSSEKTSLSEEIQRPDVPFRRDGTFCIDEPTVLKKQSPSSDQADV